MGTSGDRYNVIRVSSKQQNNSEPVCNDSMSLENAHLQEEMYSRYASEIQYLADMGFTNFAVLFPILKAMVPVPASETERRGQCGTNQRSCRHACCKNILKLQ